MDSNDREYINTFFDGIKTTIDKIDGAEIEKVIELLFAAWMAGRKVFVIGNGGSASIASHFAADLNKCTAHPGKMRFKAMSLVDNLPLLSALTNDDGWDNVYSEQLKNFFEPGDVVLAISVHGGSGSDKAGLWSQNLLKAMQYAKDNHGVTIGFSGFDGGAMKQLADVCIVVPADSTPLVESMHSVLHHLIAFRLAEKIVNES